MNATTIQDIRKRIENKKRRLTLDQVRRYQTLRSIVSSKLTVVQTKLLIQILNEVEQGESNYVETNKVSFGWDNPNSPEIDT